MREGLELQMGETIRPLPPDPAAIVARFPGVEPRVLVFGAMGTGKTTLAAGIARAWDGGVYGISADPGSPAFGIPGAVNLGDWQQDAWQRLDSVPLCTLDAARFRLPLVQAVGRLAHGVRGRALIVDAPGVARGVAAAELLQGIVAAAAIDMVVLLDTDEAAGLSADIDALGCPVLRIIPSPYAHRPPRHHREQHRTALWNAHLCRTCRHQQPLHGLRVVGTPPPLSAPDAWRGRQVAFMGGRAAPVMGEVVCLEADRVVLELAAAPEDRRVLLVRDAERNSSGRLVTAPPMGRALGAAKPPSDGVMREAVAVTLGGVEVRLVNGVFGDPLLELKVANVRQSVLFDLGDAAGLPVRALHQVSDVFVSHAHIDHVGGFVSLLRARLSGSAAPCRVYGPPGIRDNIAGFVAGVHWDRIGDEGPEFLVGEIDQTRLSWTRIKPGRDLETLGSETLTEGALLRRDGFRVRHTVLDHGIPVLAFALELDDTLQVREECLAHSGLEPGSWLRSLKHEIARGRADALIELPDGGRRSAGELRDRLLRAVAGTRIAYATDLADTAANRRSLCDLARGADLFVCEATFLPMDAAQARATKHLTVAACVEIALEAEVGRLLPFHFSRRYGSRADELRAALTDACRGTLLEGKLVGPVRVVRR